MTRRPTTPFSATDDLAEAAPSAHLLEKLQLYGYRPFQDEPDPRPLPEADQARAEIGACLETPAGLLTGTRLEDDLDDNAFEFFRDAAAEMYEALTGSTWRPRQGFQLNHRTLPAAIIDSPDHIAARRHAGTNQLRPPGPKVAFTGGVECNDVDHIWAALDKVHAKHPDMVLLHGGSPK